MFSRLILIFFVALAWGSQAQIGSGLAFYVEGAGSAGDFSFNFEYGNIHAGPFKIDFRAGFGAGTFYEGGKPRHFMGIPVGIHAVTDWVSPSRVEFGLDASYIDGRAVWEDNQSQTLVLVPICGYRFHLPGGKLLVRATFTPLIPIKEYGKISMSFPDESSPTAWFGLSLGYYFRKSDNTSDDTQ